MDAHYKMLELVLELVKAGIDIELKFDPTTKEVRAYFENGFYKSDGFAYIVQDGGDLFLRARYNDYTRIASFEDVVACSMYWYTSSKDRYKGWANPSENWAHLYT